MASTKSSEVETKQYEGTETILVAEDDRMVLDLVELYLDRFGNNAITAINGVDALDKYRKNHDSIKFVILDVVMPVMKGIKTYEEIKKIRSDIKVIFLSADIQAMNSMNERRSTKMNIPLSISRFLPQTC